MGRGPCRLWPGAWPPARSRPAGWPSGTGTPQRSRAHAGLGPRPAVGACRAGGDDPMQMASRTDHSTHNDPAAVAVPGPVFPIGSDAIRPETHGDRDSARVRKAAYSVDTSAVRCWPWAHASRVNPRWHATTARGASGGEVLGHRPGRPGRFGTGLASSPRWRRASGGRARGPRPARRIRRQARDGIRGGRPYAR